MLTNRKQSVDAVSELCRIGPGSDPKSRTSLRCASTPPAGSIAGMTEVCELTGQLRREVFVRSPRRSGLTRVLTSMGATVLAEPGHGLSVTGMDACRIASAAAAHYIPIQELTPRSVLAAVPSATPWSSGT